MKKKVLYLIITMLTIHFITVPANIYASVQPGTDQAKKQENDKKDNKKDIVPAQTAIGISHSSGANCGANCNSINLDDKAALLCLGIGILFVILYFNSSVYYSAYPYEDPEGNNFNFIDHHQLAFDKKTLPRQKKIPGTMTYSDETIEQHHVYLTFESGFQYSGNNKSVVFGEISGRFWNNIGPHCEYRYIKHKDGELRYGAFGITIPIFQHDYFTSEFYAQYAMLNGTVTQDGSAFGGMIRSYPIKPVSLYAKIGKQVFEKTDILDQEQTIDYDLRISLHSWRFEFFGGFRSISSSIDNFSHQGPYFGIKFWL